MESRIIEGLLFALILAIIFHAFGSRYAPSTTILNDQNIETYIIDRWTGNAWMCKYTLCDPVVFTQKN